MSDDYHIIAIGGSAGGVDALGQLVAALAPDLNAAIFVVMHITPSARSALPQILSRANTIPASHPRDGQRIQPGRIYVAPPDKHLLLRKGLIQLSAGPRENGCRPAIDPLFRSAADTYGNRVAGIVLSGLLADGASGLLSIKRHGGIALVQDPEEAAFPGMPLSAIGDVQDVDLVGPIAEVAEFINKLCELPVKNYHKQNDTIETRIAAMDAGPESTKLLGDKSEFGCPECGGTLWEIADDDSLRFRCRVGHAYTAQALAVAQDDSVEVALWSAIRALQEQADLFMRLSRRMDKRRESLPARRYTKKAEHCLEQAAILREIIDGTSGTVADEPPEVNESSHNETMPRGVEDVKENPA